MRARMTTSAGIPAESSPQIWTSWASCPAPNWTWLITTRSSRRATISVISWTDSITRCSRCSMHKKRSRLVKLLEIMRLWKKATSMLASSRPTKGIFSNLSRAMRSNSLATTTSSSRSCRDRTFSIKIQRSRLVRLCGWTRPTPRRSLQWACMMIMDSKFERIYDWPICLCSHLSVSCVPIGGEAKSASSKESCPRGFWSTISSETFRHSCIGQGSRTSWHAPEALHQNCRWHMARVLSRPCFHHRISTP